ncbi:ubiquinone biosynthesis accessory factor UbiJ [Duganella phyllosphaerae]|uniref:Ubiquinone biosynthesis accessory factor UbiJ n=1 Tax=Duganella phyllosphaerae TaxID=762836 RepID=A0A1E7WGF4_9BURK|nr:SCP2 sterol-binding domain-containing protein [Duganella phyllosphaerae]OEZ97512.1 SCP-2 sterol transfer family protein [Duganella phyllosphaerae]
MTIPNPSVLSAAAPASAVINHLLAQEPWARRELQRHAGKVAAIDAGVASLRLRVTVDGLLEAAPAEAVASVTIRVKPTDLPLIVQDRERAFSYVRIEGDAEFANALSSLSQSLRWEAEVDLEKVVGPLAANRMVSGARAALGAVKAGHQKIAENVAEYLLDEKQLLVRPHAVEELSADVTRLRDDVERAAKRLAKLEQKLGIQ